MYPSMVISWSVTWPLWNRLFKRWTAPETVNASPTFVGESGSVGGTGSDAGRPDQIGTGVYSGSAQLSAEVEGEATSAADSALVASVLSGFGCGRGPPHEASAATATEAPRSEGPCMGAQSRRVGAGSTSAALSSRRTPIAYHPTMKTAWAAASALVLSWMPAVAKADCHHDPRALALANEADKLRSIDLRGAIAKLEEAHRLEPTSTRILVKLAEAETKAEQWDEAYRAFTLLTQLAPKNADYAFRQGLALEKLAAKGGRTWDEAAEPFERAIRLDPHFAKPHFELAEVVLRSGAEQKALERYTKAIELAPNELGFYAPLADLYRRLGFLQEAEQVARAGISWETDSTRSSSLHLLLGSVLVEEGRSPEAIVELEKAKQACGSCTAPDDVEVPLALGVALAAATPPRKSEAIELLVGFDKRVCRSPSAARHAVGCAEARAVLTSLGAVTP